MRKKIFILTVLLYSFFSCHIHDIEIEPVDPDDLDEEPGNVITLLIR